MAGDESPPSSTRNGPADASSFGAYQLIARIAHGGMASVYLCRRAGEGGFRRLFALKVLHPHLSDEAELADSLPEEARIAAMIHHPNVVSIVDLGAHSEGYYIVMDYVEGCSLAQLMKSQPERRPAELIVAIAIDALRGLHAAHTLTDDLGVEMNLVHRDVSPHNILVGVDGVARVTDFGIAKVGHGVGSSSAAGQGKTEYMSPEQIRDEVLDARSDVFSMGVVLWNALTGQNLFRAENDPATMRNVLEEDIPAPSTVGLHPPEELDSVVIRALERDATQRFQSADEMAAELERVAGRAQLHTRPAEVAEWVKTVFEDELNERRRKISESARAPKVNVATVNSGGLNMPSVTGSFPSIPSLTGSSSQAQAEGSQGEAQQPPTGAQASSANAAPFHEPPKRRRAVLLVLGLAVAIGGGAFAVFGSSDSSDGPPGSVADTEPGEPSPSGPSGGPSEQQPPSAAGDAPQQPGASADPSKSTDPAVADRSKPTDADDTGAAADDGASDTEQSGEAKTQADSTDESQQAEADERRARRLARIRARRRRMREQRAQEQEKEQQKKTEQPSAPSSQSSSPSSNEGGGDSSETSEQARSESSQSGGEESTSSGTSSKQQDQDSQSEAEDPGSLERNPYLRR